MLEAAAAKHGPSEWVGRIVEIDYESSRVVVRYEGTHPHIGEVVYDHTRVARAVLLLRELIDVEGPQPGTADWAERVAVVLKDFEAPA